MSLLVIGEMGEAFKIDSGADLKKQYDIYIKRMGLEPNDVYLLDIKGKTIYFNDMTEISNEPKYFIFNKTFQKEQLMKIFEENVDKLVASASAAISSSFPMVLNPNAIPDVASSFGLLDQNSKFLNGLTPHDFSQTLEKILEAYENCKNAYKSMKIHLKICEKIRENYGYQYNSLECIYKNISFMYEQCLLKQRETESNLAKLNEKNEKTLKMFKESIDKLKSIELHPKMQNPKEKCLIDIYFDEAKMNVWKEKCLKQSDFITLKIKSKCEVILSEKAKIRNEKNTHIVQLKNDWSNINQEYDTVIQDKESSAVGITSSIYDDLKIFSKCFTTIVDIFNLNLAIPGSSYAMNIEEAVDHIKILKSKYENFKDMIQQMTNLGILEEFSKKMKGLLQKSAIKINMVFTNYHQIKKVLLEIMEKLEKYSEGLSSLEKDFSYLQNPFYFPQAYQTSIIEIKRRIIFNKKIMRDFERLKQLIVKENLNRKQFIQDYGKYLTHDYVPQLKFSDLRLVIDFNNNNELNNLPNLLDEDEENTINNNNLYLEYEETSLGENLLVEGKLNCVGNNISQNIPSGNPPSVSGSVSVNPSAIKSVRKNSEDNKKIPESDEVMRGLNTKLSELEILHNVKESEIKKLIAKVDQKDRKITYLQTEIEKLSNTVENISENFLKQMAYKDQKLKDKSAEIENLTKVINCKTNNKLDNCPMCKEFASNSIDYQGWANFVRDYHDKLVEKNKNFTKLETRFQELVTHTNFVKKTFFAHLNSVIESKNNEMMACKQNYESKLMHMEDLLSFEKMNLENHLKESKNGNKLEEELNHKTKALLQVETKLKDFNKIFSNYELENKKLKQEKENLKKSLDEAKMRENNIMVDIKLKDSKYEALLNENKAMEKQIDLHKKKYNQLSEEIVGYIKEITSMKCTIEHKSKMIEELERSLENSKVNHIDTLNEVHKANQGVIEKMSMKMDEMTNLANERLKVINESKAKVEELEDTVRKQNAEIKSLSLSMKDSDEKHISQMDECRKTIEKLNENNHGQEDEITGLKRKLDELSQIMQEKDKRLGEFNEITKFFSTTDNNYLTTNTKTNTNNELVSTDNHLLNNISLSMAISNYLVNKADIDEYINVKKIEKGQRVIFVPHSNGIYVCINLIASPSECSANFENNYDYNKYYKCNAILNIDEVNEDLRELLLENSLIIIGKVGKVVEYTPTTENNTYQLPEDATYTLVGLDKIDYIIGFQGDEMIFRNYLF